MAENMWMCRTDSELGCRTIVGKQERVLAFVKRHRTNIVELRRVPK